VNHIGDAKDNLTVDYGGLTVILGHMNRDSIPAHMRIQKAEVRSGQVVGETGDPRGATPHLHLGVRTAGYIYYNPLYNQKGVDFTTPLVNRIYPTIRAYAMGFQPLDMLSYEGGAYASWNFWNEIKCPPPYPGIVFRWDRYGDSHP